MIKTLVPYGYIKESLIKCFWEWRGEYYLEDLQCNQYLIDKKTYEDLLNDRS